MHTVSSLSFFILVSVVISLTSAPEPRIEAEVTVSVPVPEPVIVILELLRLTTSPAAAEPPEPAAITVRTKSVLSTAPKVSFEPAVNVTEPEAVDVSVNERLTVTCESDSPPLLSVLSVLIAFFCSLRRRTFLFWSLRFALLRVAATEVIPLDNAELIVSVLSSVIASITLSSRAPDAPDGKATISPTFNSPVKSVWKPLIVVPEPE